MAEQKDLGGGLKARIDRGAGGTMVALSGHINEKTDLTPLKELPPPLTLDLEHVDRINSIGVGKWLHFVRDIEQSGQTLTFERCSPQIVLQISMISNFVGTRSRVKSLFVVYVCPSCSTEHLHLSEVVYGKPLGMASTMSCPKCKSAMQVDDMSTYTDLFEAQR
jgi:anti-anti-sigma regulatory factor